MLSYITSRWIKILPSVVSNGLFWLSKIISAELYGSSSIDVNQVKAANCCSHLIAYCSMDFKLSESYLRFHFIIFQDAYLVVEDLINQHGKAAELDMFIQKDLLQILTVLPFDYML